MLVCLQKTFCDFTYMCPCRPITNQKLACEYVFSKSTLYSRYFMNNTTTMTVQPTHAISSVQPLVTIRDLVHLLAVMKLKPTMSGLGSSGPKFGRGSTVTLISQNPASFSDLEMRSLESRNSKNS